MFKKLALLLYVSLSSIALAQSADLGVFKEGPDSVVRGTQVTYSVTVTNGGPSAASNVVLTDVLTGDATFVSVTPSAGCTGTTCTIASLASGASRFYEFTFQTDADGTGTLENTATVTSATPDGNANNNSANVSTALTGSTDLAVTKTGPATVPAGSNVTYTITLTNFGPDAAQGVTLTDPIPAGMTFVSATQLGGPAFSCDLPAAGDPGTVACTQELLAAGAQATFSFVFAIGADTEPGTQFTNIVTATSETFELNEENNAAVAVTSTPPPPRADLAVTKSGPGAIGPDRDLTFTVTLRNNGPDAATNVTLSDTLPGNLTFVSLQQSGAPLLNCTAPAIGAGGTITCTAPTFAAGGNVTLTFTAHVPAGTPSGTEYANTAIVTSDTDPNEENNVATFTATVSSVDVSVVKTGPATVTANDNISYGITVSNAGPDLATGITLRDALPPGTTFVSITRNSGPASSCALEGNAVVCSNLALAVNQSATFTLVLDPGANSQVTNTATVTSELFDTDPPDNTSSVTTTVTPVADLSVSKTGPATVTAGTTATYTVTITNLGPSPATNVVVTDVLTGDATFVSVTPSAGCTGTTCTLASGASAIFSYTFLVDADATGTLDDTASVSATTSDPVPGNNNSMVSTSVVASADVAIAKTGPATVTPGSDVTYTVTVTNNGPSTATNVVVTDVLTGDATFVSVTPSAGCTGTTCTIATLAPGASAIFTYTFHVAANGTGTLNDTASVSSATPDPVAGNNSSPVTTSIVPTADVAVSKTGPSTVTPGTNVIYTVTVTNNGPSTATNVVLTDTLAGDATFVSVTPSAGCSGTTCTIATLASGASAIFNYTFHLDPDATGGVENTATVTASTHDPVAGNNTSIVTSPVAGSADLAVTKSGPATVTPGTDVTYAVTVRNNGPSTATNVVLNDLILGEATFVSVTPSTGCSGANCAITTLAPGASALFNYTFHVAPSATLPIQNNAQVLAETDDPVSGNDMASVTSAVVGSADVSVVKSGPGAVTSGTNATFTIVVANAGPSDAANVVLNDVLPANTTFVSLNQTGQAFNCTTGPTVTCTIATLPVSTSTTFTLVVSVSAAAAGSIDNTATVTSSTADPNAANNSSTATLGLNPGPTDLSITKSANSNSFGFGGAVTYTLVVTNNGPAVAFGTTVTDVLPAGTTLQSASSTQGTCTGTSTVVCSVGTLAPAATATVTLVVTLPREQTTVTNTATVTAANAETAPGNNAATVALAVTAEIPTVSEWGLLLLAMTLGILAVRTMRA